MDRPAVRDCWDQPRRKLCSERETTTDLSLIFLFNFIETELASLSFFFFFVFKLKALCLEEGTVEWGCVAASLCSHSAAICIIYNPSFYFERISLTVLTCRKPADCFFCLFVLFSFLPFQIVSQYYTSCHGQIWTRRQQEVESVCLSLWWSFFFSVCRFSFDFIQKKE